MMAHDIEQYDATEKVVVAVVVVEEEVVVVVVVVVHVTAVSQYQIHVVIVLLNQI